MALYRLKKIDFRHEDQRGALLQLVHEGYRQINVLETREGVARGGHYHKISNEAFFVVRGSVEVALQDLLERATVKFTKGDFFEIPPHVGHSMYFPEDCTLIVMYDTPVEKEDGTKDIYNINSEES